MSIDAVARAAALRTLVATKREPIESQMIIESVVGCAADLVNAGEIDLALRLLESSEAAVGSTVTERRLRFDAVRARALRSKGHYQESIAVSQRVFSEQPQLIKDCPELAYDLRINEAACYVRLNRADDGIERLEGIRSELVLLPDSSLLATCTLQLSTAELIRGDLRRARDFAMEALVSARRVGNRYVEALALDNLGRCERFRCRWNAAAEASEEALRIFQHEGFTLLTVTAMRCLAIIHWKAGRITQALEFAHASYEGSRRIGGAVHEWYGALLNSAIRIHSGDLVKSSDFLAVLADRHVLPEDSRPFLLTTEYLGDIHLEQGQAKEALRYFDEVWPKAVALVPKGDIVAELRRRKAEAYYLLGRFEEAYAEAKTGLEHCRELGDRYEEAATYRVLALSAAATGKASEAKRWFDQGFAYYDDIETPYEWGKLWMAYGDWLRGSHAGEFADPRGALEAYQAAHDHFERMGALAKLAEANARIAALRDGDAAVAKVRDDGARPAPLQPQRRPRGSAELDRRSLWARETFGLVTRSKQVLHILEDVAKLAKSNSPVLVLGESGTGKELVAQGLHRISGRAGAFIPINCSALPREMIESELFGHVAGSFSGAIRDKQGLFEACDGGTAFLDEIAEMSVELQARLLRFLETGESRRVGSSRNISVNTRVVAATNRDRGALERGEGFRTDLYYRLAHAVVVLPPLRRRGDDVELLIDHFLEEACTQAGKRVTLSRAAHQRLLAYSWPGNVRQLRAVIERLVILSAPGHEVGEARLQLEQGQAPTTLLEELEHAERRRIAEALTDAGGSRTEAARALGIPRTTFINKLRRYGLG